MKIKYEICWRATLGMIKNKVRMIADLQQVLTEQQRRLEEK